jgi:hypothetical protein
LKVGNGIDRSAVEYVQAREAACKYLRPLILDFGARISVMLALAACNTGSTKLKQAS